MTGCIRRRSRVRRRVRTLPRLENCEVSLAGAGRRVSHTYLEFATDRGVRHLIVDGDPLYTAAARNLLRDSTVTLVRLPARSPNLNACAERFVGSVRSGCLAPIVPLGETHLRSPSGRLFSHYHEERPHQGSDNSLLAPTEIAHAEGPLRRRTRLGDMLNFYYRAAA